MLLAILVALVTFIITFAMLFLFGTPVWFIFFPIFLALLVGRLVAERVRR